MPESPAARIPPAPAAMALSPFCVGARSLLQPVDSRILAVHIVLWLTMRFSGALIKVIGENGVTLITRIAGLLLSAIAVQLVANAIRAFVQGSG